MNVLIVDDDPIAIELLNYFLQEAGYDVERASKGKQALEKMRTFSPRIIISDVEMPEMIGIELHQAFRECRQSEMACLHPNR
ncbi:MAG: PleD family two-component system response regulator [Pirellula sp.]